MMERLARYVKTPLLIVMPFVWLVAILLLFSLTSPLRVGPAGILLVFALFYAFVCSALFGILYGVLGAWSRLSGKTRISRRQMYYLASVLGIAPVFLVALNTLSRLGVVEVALVLLLVGLAGFYVLRRGEM